MSLWAVAMKQLPNNCNWSVTRRITFGRSSEYMDALATGQACLTKGTKTMLGLSNGSRKHTPVFRNTAATASGKIQKAILLRCAPRSPSKLHSSSSLSTVTFCAPAQSQPQVDQGDTCSSSVEAPNGMKTVSVRFQLKKECLFGEQFLLVGNDTSIGSWDPYKAVPMEWSEGHVWMVNLDLPVEKDIQFKFIHRDFSGQIKWQPGADRVFTTYETTKSVILSEEWENTESRMMVEQEQQIQMHSSTDVLHGNNKAVFDVQESMQEDLSNQDIVLVPELAHTEEADLPISSSFPSSEEHKNDEGFSSAEDERDVPEQKRDTLMTVDLHPADDIGVIKQRDVGTQEDKFQTKEGSISNLKVMFGIFKNDIQWGKEVFQSFLLSLGSSEKEQG